MPKTQPNRRPQIPAGAHLLTLVSVEEVEVAAMKRKPTDPDKIKKWAWRFESDMLDEEDGAPFEYTHWTNSRYGHAKANLTQLLNMICPELSAEQKAALNTDTLLQRRFKAFMIRRPSQTDPSKMIADIGSIEPATGADAQAPERFDPDEKPADEMPL